MNRPRRLLLSFEPTFGNVDMVRAAVRGVCTDFFKLADSASSIMDFCLIVSELMNNAVEHTDASVLDVEILLSDHEATFCLISQGSGFDPTTTAEMPTLDQNEELPEGGYGLAIIQALADGVEYERNKNRNMVTLRKIFPINGKKGR